MPTNRSTLILLPVFAIALIALRAFDEAQEESLEFASTAGSSMAEMMPAINAALEQIQRGNKLNAVMTQGPTPARASNPTYTPPVPDRIATSGGICTDCDGPRVADMRYMQCNSRNNYLEQRLATMRHRGGLLGDLLKAGPKANTLLKPICIRMSLESRFGENTPTFASCAPGESKANSNQIRPCVSENYFAMINNSFDLVARCMAPMISDNIRDQRDDVRMMFGMLNVESGLHSNAISPTGAAGIGQFTSDSIDDINDHDFPMIRDKLEEMGGECARMGAEILPNDSPMRASSSRSCDRVALERGNPLLSMIYMFASIAREKKEVSEDFFEDRRFGRFFSSLSSSDRNRLMTTLAMWSHNTGPAGLRTPLMALLNTHYRGEQVTNVGRFLSELTQAIRAYPHSANSSDSRRRETSNYWPSVSSNLSKIERDAGGGSCVQR